MTRGIDHARRAGKICHSKLPALKDLLGLFRPLKQSGALLVSPVALPLGHDGLCLAPAVRR